MSGPVNIAEQRFREFSQRARTLRQNANAARQRARNAANHPLLKQRSIFNKTFKRRTENERKNKNKAKTLRNNLQRAANKAEENATTASIMANNSKVRWNTARANAERAVREAAAIERAREEARRRGPTPANIPRVQQTPAYVPEVPGARATWMNAARAAGPIQSRNARMLLDELGGPQEGSLQEHLFGTTGHEPNDFLEKQGYIIGRPGMQQRDMQMIQEQQRLQAHQDFLNNSTGRSQKVKNAYKALGKKGLVPFFRNLHRWRT